MHCFRLSHNICKAKNAAKPSLNFPYIALSKTTDPGECHEICTMGRIRSTVPAEAKAAMEAVGRMAI